MVSKQNRNTENVLILILSQQIGRGVQSDPKSKAKEICSHLSEAWAVVLLRHLRSRIPVLYVHLRKPHIVF